MRECLENVRRKKPLIHNITNYVTINDVANILLACGGSPIMAEAAEEVEEITSGCDGLNINMGMLNPAKARAMELAGVQAQKNGHVILLDPVGAGASSFRRETAGRLLEKIKFTAIRGNISEIRAVAEIVGMTHSDVGKNQGAYAAGCGMHSNAVIMNEEKGQPGTAGEISDHSRRSGGKYKKGQPGTAGEISRTKSRGVDAVLEEAVTEENAEAAEEFIKELARHTGSIIAVTGKLDLVADDKNCYRIRNGRPEMSRITGTGCQLSGMMTAFLAANRDCHLKAAAAAVCCMGLAGEKAWEYRKAGEGNASYRNRIIDAVSLMEGDELEKGARYEIC